MHHMAVPPMTEHESIQALNRMLRPDEYARHSYHFAIVRREDDAVVGTFGIDHERFSSAYTHTMMLHRASWGTGIAREAYHLLLGFAFDELRVHRVWTACETRNERARRLITGVGFTSFGTIREYYQKNDRWGDCESFNYLVHEWRAHVARPNRSAPQT